MANLYFFILMLMELYKPISDSNGKPVLAGPLAFVVIVSMIKDSLEDSRRTKSDEEENNINTHFCERGKAKFDDGKALNVQVGCLIKVKNDQFFPCDMILLKSSLPKGICFVETKGLDGETNLKHK
jgi:phospholipid-transporting ATPase